MLSFGLSAEQEQAADAQFDYDNWSLNSKVSHKFDLLGQEKNYSLVGVIKLAITKFRAMLLPVLIR